jgi:hypothetical protein
MSAWAARFGQYRATTTLRRFCSASKASERRDSSASEPTEGVQGGSPANRTIRYGASPVRDESSRGSKAAPVTSLHGLRSATASYQCDNMAGWQIGRAPTAGTLHGARPRSLVGLVLPTAR